MDINGHSPFSISSIICFYFNFKFGFCISIVAKKSLLMEMCPLDDLMNREALEDSAKNRR